LAILLEQQCIEGKRKGQNKQRFFQVPTQLRSGEHGLGATGARESLFKTEIIVKNQVLSRNMIRWFLDRWSFPLLWNLSDISAICNVWPQLQILGGVGQLTQPSQVQGGGRRPLAYTWLHACRMLQWISPHQR